MVLPWSDTEGGGCPCVSIVTGPNDTAATTGATTTSDGNHSHPISGTIDSSSGNETRPVNAYVNYIIKY